MTSDDSIGIDHIYIGDGENDETYGAYNAMSTHSGGLHFADSYKYFALVRFFLR
jgi:hypothetical protein